jgi:RNA polymerase sigma factor (TIGR02999 family)
MRVSTDTITKILGDINAGRASMGDLLPVVYADLQRLASISRMRHGDGNTLHTTALVHEVAGRLLDHDRTDWKSRAHFFAASAQAMRQVLTDHARRRVRVKRGGGRERVMLSDLPAAGENQVDLLTLHDALSDLGETDERTASVVVFRFFAGMTTREIAHVLGVSESTVESDWRAARAWLSRELERGWA